MIRCILYVYNLVEREIEGERIGKRNKEREGKEIGELVGVVFIIFRKYGCFIVYCV